MVEVLQSNIPYPTQFGGKLPGVQPLGDAPVLLRDDAHDGQMALRDELLRTRRADVLRMQERAEPAAHELLNYVIETLYPDQTTESVLTRPDGVRVVRDAKDPLATVGRLTQQDFCILQKCDDEHVLTGAVLCFPASWTLAQKIGRPLTRIHDPVSAYDEQIARRVQRLFDGIQVGKPLWRYNLLTYEQADLFAPRPEYSQRLGRESSTSPFLRSERQVMLRLPQSRDVVFCIHTSIVRRQPFEG